jgi:hypothetical protein
VFNYSQPQTSSTQVPGSSPIHAVETFEQTFEMLRWNPLPGVFNKDPSPRARFAANCDHTSIPVELDRVIHKIGEHLFKASGVDEYKGVVRDVVAYGNAARRRFRVKRHDHIID